MALVARVSFISEPSPGLTTLQEKEKVLLGTDRGKPIPPLCFARQVNQFSLKTAAFLADEAKSLRQLSRMFNRPWDQQADSPRHAKAPSASQFGAATVVGREATAPPPITLQRQLSTSGLANEASLESVGSWPPVTQLSQDTHI